MRHRARWKVRALGGRTASVLLAACALAAGCQQPPFDHVDKAASTFNASHVPNVDRQQSVAGAGSQDASASAAGEGAKSPAIANEALVVENLNLGHREAALNRLDEAVVYYRRVLDIQPENSVANHRLAVIADKKHDFARAEHYYLTALRHDGRDPDLLGDLGYSYLLQGRRDESERCLLAATRLDPSHAKALHNLSLLYAMNGDYDRSFDALRRAVGESEARAKIVRLFPNGRPPAADGDPIIASFQPSEPQEGGLPIPAPPVDAAPAEGPAPAIATSAPLPAANIESAAVPIDSRPVAVPNTATGRIPDSQMNDRFAAIDHEAEQKSPRPPIDSTLSALMPQTSAPPQGAETGRTNAGELRAAPGTDPLASMPLWSPGGSGAQSGKPPAAFSFDPESPQPPHPRAVLTGITPASVDIQSALDSGKADALKQFEERLKNERPIGPGRMNSNVDSSREPLIAVGPPGERNVEDPRAAGDSGRPAPFDASSPIHIEPRSNPAPLFEPVEGFGPSNDFSPGDNLSVPAWPGTNGNPAPANGDAGDTGPVIRPRPAN